MELHVLPLLLMGAPASSHVSSWWVNLGQGVDENVERIKNGIDVGVLLQCLTWWANMDSVG